MTDLTPSHVTHWLTLHPGLDERPPRGHHAVDPAGHELVGTGGDLLKAMGVRSPLAGMEKPPQGASRATGLRGRAERHPDQRPRRMLPGPPSLAAWDTGARPDELFTVEASFFDATNSVWIFPLKESKGKRTRRVVSPH